MEPFFEPWRTSCVEKMISISTHVAGVYLRLESCPLKLWAK